MVCILCCFSGTESGEHQRQASTIGTGQICKAPISFINEYLCTQMIIYHTQQQNKGVSYTEVVQGDCPH